MIGLIGLDHHGTNVELLGRLAIPADRVSTAFQLLAEDGAVDEAVILSTCHRTEIYVAANDWPRATASVHKFLADVFAHGSSYVAAAALARSGGVASGAVPEAAPVSAAGGDTLPGDVAAGLYEYVGVEAARHLLRVAAGLRSMVAGEAQILGQVKDALVAAEAAKAIGDELRAVFALAIRIGKRVRSETELGRADESVAALAVQVARTALGSLNDKAALLIGAGKTNRLCATLLCEAGVTRHYLANRTPQAASELAREVGGEAISLADVAGIIPAVQLVICATAAPHTVLSAAAVAAATAGRRAPLVIIDLAVPPDVEPAASLLPTVTLYTLDTLTSAAQAAEGTLPSHEAEMVAAERIVEDGVREFTRSGALRLAVPGIAALRQHVDESEQAELARALAQLSHLALEDRAIVERFGRRLVDKMFFHLVSRIRSLAEYDEVPTDVTMRVLSRLFAETGPPTQRDDEPQ
jgi:glutamyl-tRNA reductase